MRFLLSSLLHDETRTARLVARQWTVGSQTLLDQRWPIVRLQLLIMVARVSVKGESRVSQVKREGRGRSARDIIFAASASPSA